MRHESMAPTVKETHIDGVLIVNGVRFNDHRGFFKELYNERDFPPEVRIDHFRQVTPPFFVAVHADHSMIDQSIR